MSDVCRESVHPGVIIRILVILELCIASYSSLMTDLRIVRYDIAV